MFNPSSTDDAVSFPTELNLLRAQSASLAPARRLNSVSTKGASSKSSGQVIPWDAARTQGKSGTWRSPEPDLSLDFSDLVSSYAAPLSPLRDRDLKTLSSFFEREDMHDIETDVIRNLLSRWPEPCWEDDPFDFLREYL